jgi:pilus assembly protein Flp/PilA
MVKLLILKYRAMVKDSSGATAIEYGLIAAATAITIIGGLALIGPQLKSTFDSIATALTG